MTPPPHCRVEKAPSAAAAHAPSSRRARSGATPTAGGHGAAQGTGAAAEHGALRAESGGVGAGLRDAQGGQRARARAQTPTGGTHPPQAHENTHTSTHTGTFTDAVGEIPLPYYLTAAAPAGRTGSEYKRKHPQPFTPVNLRV